MANERSRGLGGGPSQGSEQGGADRRDPGAEALLELARMIGGQGDPFAPETSKIEPRMSEPRLGEVSRAAAAARDSFDFPGRHAPADQDFDAGGRMSVRREEEFADEYGDGNFAEPEDYDDEGDRGVKRRRPTRLIMAVLGLAVFGTAAAYGYRYLINAAPSGPPPTIRADNSPTKITRMSDMRGDGGRAGDRIAEQMVRRDEDPVDVGTGGASDMVPAGAGAAASAGDPKRVHTVPINANQGTASSPDRPSVRAAAMPSAAPVPRQVAAQPAPPPQPAPLPRVAAVAPAPAPPDTSAVESGGYVVQLAAVRTSEADAQTRFHQLQTKYPMLSGRQPLIRRKDQGDRGVFFAAQVGPFGAKSEAEQLCGELKAAGGDCYVLKN